MSDYHDRLGDLSSDIESMYEAEELDLHISIIVEQMPEQRRKVFTMSRYEGLKQHEIAEKLNISPVTVSRHLSDAVEQIKKMLTLIAILFPIIEK